MSSIFVLPVLVWPVSEIAFIGTPIVATLLAGAAYGWLLARARHQFDDVGVRMFGLAMGVSLCSFCRLATAADSGAERHQAAG